MRLLIKAAEVKVRDKGVYGGTKKKFTGATTYAAVGSLDGARVRHSLGTHDKRTAIRLIDKIETAFAIGTESPAWYELEASLPAQTFQFFAQRAGYTRPDGSPTGKADWSDLCNMFELEMERRVANKLRGAPSEQGTMSEGTRERYRQTVRMFTAFLGNRSLRTDEINGIIIEKFKVHRQKQILGLKQSRGASSIALDVAILHRVFAFAMTKGLCAKNPINLSTESKPGKNPKNGARAFTADELKKLREKAGDDLFTFLLLRWTGLRGSDAVNLRWHQVRLDQGSNGEIELVTQKRSKLAVIPLATELRDALEEVQAKRSKTQKIDPDNYVLHNPETNEPFTTRKRLYERMKALGVRAGVRRVTPHCFRDTFACDMLARDCSIFDVAKMLADTVSTVEMHYAAFVPAARDAAQSKMDRGLGIEERAKLARSRNRKVVGFPAGSR